MKAFDNFSFDKKTYDVELKEFENLLSTKPTLSERKDIIPFFTTRHHLSSRLASLVPHINNVDKIAFEFDLFGDFRCDLVVGDSKTKTFCFIEFENAVQDSIFKSTSPKFQPDYAPRLEHGYSQMVDWAYSLRNKSSKDLKDRFGYSEIKYDMMLIIGRDSFLDDKKKDRLAWRSQHVIVDSRKFWIITFDELLSLLKDKQAYS